jgi:hypothetical protein
MKAVRDACELQPNAISIKLSVVVSDLFAAYQSGGALINRALDNARQELGRGERNITPVDLAANEIYDILRTRLFVTLPDEAEIEDVAEQFGRKLEEAAKSKTAIRPDEAKEARVLRELVKNQRLG